MPAKDVTYVNPEVMSKWQKENSFLIDLYSSLIESMALTHPKYITTKENLLHLLADQKDVMDRIRLGFYTFKEETIKTQGDT